MGKTYRVGTRTSPLALKQVEEVITDLKKYYLAINPVRNFVLPGSKYDISNGIKVEIIGINTYGDKDKVTPISQIEGTDFFTKEIDDAILKGEIDFAIHSAKDLPDSLKEGLVIAALTKSIDPYDVLVSRDNLRLDELPSGARVGTSSLRRKTQLKKYRHDFEIVDIRGNIEERLKLLDNHERQTTNDERRDLDAIVIAAAGLVRLSLEDRITQRIPLEILKPHPLQGALAVIARDGRLELLDLLSAIDSREAVSL